MLGLYVCDHPLLGVEAALRRKVDCSASPRPPSARTASMLVLGGVITNMARKFTKKGDQMAVFVLEDLDSTIEVTVFPRALMEHGHKLVDDAIVTVKGRVDKRDEVRVGFMAHDVNIIEGLDTRLVGVAAAQGAVDVAQRAENPSDPQDSSRPPRRLAGLPAHRPRQDIAPGRRVLRRPRPGRSASCECCSVTTP